MHESLAELSGSSLQSKVKRGCRGSIFVKLSLLLSLIYALLPATACKWGGLRSKCVRRVAGLGHSIPTAWTMWDIQLQSARLIASPTPHPPQPHSSQWAAFKVSASLSPRPI